ncbi:MAG: serine/threonine protein kinase [Acidobacteria bacterium]|nr:serine/threonine protein kinase [Acidobacteriota bacterium]
MQIGRYRVIREIGRGAMGVVYLAEDPAIGRTVAIKTIRLSEAASEEERKFLRDRLFREARSAGILSHPGIVTIYDIYEEDNVCYVFMEYVDGPTLEKMMHGDTPLDGKTVLHVLEETAAALDYAHGKGIVHRDIKPANIMVASGGAVKITDFGVAKFTSQQATSTGVLLGTPSYMSPEQISDLKISGRSDQFSLAVIAYQLLAGERPFTGATLPGLMFKIVNEEPAPLQRLNASLGAAVDVVIRKALHKEPAERYANCQAFAKALRGACEAKASWKPMAAGKFESEETVAEPAAAAPVVMKRASAPVVEEEAEPPRERRWWLIVLVGCIVIFGILALSRQMLETWVREPEAKRKAAILAQPPPKVEDRPSALGPAPPPQPPAQPEPQAAEPVAPPATKREPVKVKARPKPEPERMTEAVVRVVTNPPGAKVIFDGQPRLMCTTPCDMTLAAGRHTLSTILDGYRSQSRILLVPEETSAVVALDRALGTLTIRTTPAGATIVIDGVERAEKTPASLTLPVGRHKLEVIRQGLAKQEQDVLIKDRVTTAIDLSWGTP